MLLGMAWASREEAGEVRFVREEWVSASRDGVNCAALATKDDQVDAVSGVVGHGVQGEGQPRWRERGSDGLLPAPPHDASGHTWHHPDAQLLAITRHGLARVIGQPDYRSAMPAYEGVLSDAEILAALSWIKSRWPAAVRAQHDAVNAQARGAGG